MSTNYKVIIVDVVNIIKGFLVAKIIISLQKTDFESIRSACIYPKGVTLHGQERMVIIEMTRAH